jgi:hypothetical protein
MLARLKSAGKFAVTLASMIRIAWQAHPPGFLGLILQTALQGLMPLATVWFTKFLFDLVALAWPGT